MKKVSHSKLRFLAALFFIAQITPALAAAMNHNPDNQRAYAQNQQLSNDGNLIIFVREKLSAKKGEDSDNTSKCCGTVISTCSSCDPAVTKHDLPIWRESTAQYNASPILYTNFLSSYLYRPPVTHLT